MFTSRPLRSPPSGDAFRPTVSYCDMIYVDRTDDVILGSTFPDRSRSCYGYTIRPRCTTALQLHISSKRRRVQPSATVLP